MIKIKTEFAGGLQLLFEDKNELEFEVPQGMNIRKLVWHLRENYLKRSEEMFVVDNRDL